MSTRPLNPPPARPLVGHLAAFLGLATLIAILHGRSFWYGLMLDDYAHFAQLKSSGWSLRDLVDACRLELVGPILKCWWLPEFTLRFFRPVSFAIFKLTYVLSNWSPTAMHVASMVWHLAASTLIAILIRRVGGSMLAAWGIAAIFSIHPGHIATVEWIASQTELIGTTFSLSALLCYATLRGWGRPEAPIGTRRWLLLFSLFVLFAAALGCRENAIMLPAVLLVAEISNLRRAAAGRMKAMLGLLAPAIFGLIVLSMIYLFVRSAYLGDAALPPRPYVVLPNAPGFARYALDKICYYLLGEFFLIPCIPFGGLPYFREHALLFYGLTLLILVAIGFLSWRQRNQTLGWLAPACLFGYMLPVVPSFEAPHHLYLPGVGWALYVLIGWQDFARLIQRAKPAPRIMLRIAGWLICAGTATVFAIGTHLAGITMDAGQVVEDQIAQEIIDSPEPLHNGDTLYVANLPLIGHYVKLIVEQRTGLRDLRVVALTWAPRVLGVLSPVEFQIIDPRTIEIRLAQEEFFQGPLGLLVRESHGGRMPYELNQPTRGDGFTVTPLIADQNGIRAVRFAFDAPLDTPGVHLYWGSPTRWARQTPAAEFRRSQ